jgi:hypothetical protein
MERKGINWGDGPNSGGGGGFGAGVGRLGEH